MNPHLAVSRSRALTVSVIVAAGWLATGVLSSCSRGDEAALTTAPAVPVTSVSISPPVPPPTVAPTAAPASSIAAAPATSVAGEGADGTTPAATVPADGKVTYTVAAGDNSLEVQESPEKTTFVVTDPDQNVIYFEIFDTADPAMNDLFETPSGGGALETELVLRTDAGVEVARVRLTDLAAARVAAGQAP